MDQIPTIYNHIDIPDIFLRSEIRKHRIAFSGNNKLKIYGLLSCTSGKRMKRENRVFFSSENDAVLNGFRPCGHCMKSNYKK